MTDARAGELIIFGFEGRTAPPDLLARIADGRAAGVILFARNLGAPDEIAALTRALHDATPGDGPPIIVSVDQEGGRVQRIKQPLTLWPAMARVAAVGDLAYTEAVGRAMGLEVAALGFNVDYAPVLDVHTHPANPIIGDRAFGTELVAAATQALAFWRGLESAGVRGCGKHFPGHGDTATDSHLELPRVDADEARLRSTELRPFAEAARARVPMLMTAHVLYPAIDDAPATLSRRWLHTIAREELGYEGLIVSDDLDMKAVADRWPVRDVVVRSLAAGCDCFLACRNPTIQAEAEAALEGAPRLAAAAERVRAFRATLRRPDATAAVDAWRSLPLAEHARLAARAAS
ncbi:MAG: Beta-hexosaminidase [Myxococcales bacterium]|nr:Beta-hexosaminidase [Myxococcales bacterium]